ncbi:MAG: metallophosphoesterase [Pedobacter sp.]|nr:MAG: metallophosphoesterase [Pedobacter sp.]
MNSKAILFNLFFLLTFLWGSVSNAFGQTSDLKKLNKLKVLIISDLNGPYGTTNYSSEVLSVINRLDKLKPDLILCGGDMVAGQKRSLTEENLQAMWNSFDENIFQKIKSLKIPFGFTLGNHDASPSFSADRDIATQYWKRNKANLNLNFVDDTHFPLYYSYIQNGKFFISWDAAAAKIPQEVYDWMSVQLNLYQAKSASHRVIMGHLPLFAIVEAKNKPGEVNDAPEKALKFFKDHQVDIYISGHQHAYYPANKENILLFNAGAIGDGPRPFIGDNAPAQKAYTLVKLGKRKKPYKFYTVNPSTNKLILLKDLPRTVKGFNGELNNYLHSN